MLQVIKKDHHTLADWFTAMLEEWLQSSPNPTWSDLVEALRLPTIGCRNIAAMIEDRYIKSDDSSVQESKDTAGEYGSDYNYASVRMRKRGTCIRLCLSVCVDCYSCSRINEVQVRVSISFVDLLGYA